MAREYPLDIHNYERQFARVTNGVRNSTLSERNKELVLQYRDVCLRQGLCGRVRLIRVLGALTLFGRIVGKDFDILTRSDVEALVSALLHASPPYSPETLGTYKAILKKFLTWVVQPHNFPTKNPPPIVAWLTCHVRTKDKRRLQRRELLTPDEAARLLGACTNPRDRALTSLLWETGCRVSEIGNLQLKHLTKAPHGYLLDIDGKTGARNPLVVASAPYLSAWLAYHPLAQDPEAPLWVQRQHGKNDQYMHYATIRKLLITLFARAGIPKRPNPHGLRHARTTHLLGSGLMNEGQAKAYLGWSPTSKMLGTYAHLTAADANRAILAEHHLVAPAPNQQALAVRPCTICGETNPPTAPFCTRCNNALDETRAHQDHHEREQTHQVVLQLATLLAERGLLEEAAACVHDAGLGKALKRLAKTPIRN